MNEVTKQKGSQINQIKIPPVEVLSAEDVAISAIERVKFSKHQNSDDDEQRKEPEEALVVEEVAAGVTTDALRVPLLVQHCQEEPASMVIS